MFVFPSCHNCSTNLAEIWKGNKLYPGFTHTLGSFSSVFLFCSVSLCVIMFSGLKHSSAATGACLKWTECQETARRFIRAVQYHKYWRHQGVRPAQWHRALQQATQWAYPSCEATYQRAGWRFKLGKTSLTVITVCDYARLQAFTGKLCNQNTYHWLQIWLEGLFKKLQGTFWSHKWLVWNCWCSLYRP